MQLACQARSFGEGVYPDEAAFADVVRQIGSLGFEGLEANWMNMQRWFDRPEAFKTLLAEASLELVGPHYGGPFFNPATRDRMLDDFHRMAPFVEACGGRFVVCSGAPPKGDTLPEDIWQRVADRLNELGAVAAEHGVRIAYHNHYWESGAGGLQRLAELTGRDRVGFAFDAGNDIGAGADPVDTLRSLGEAIAVLHLKDYGDGEAAALGAGRLDLDGVKQAVSQIGFDGWVVLEEESHPADPRQHAADCLQILRRFAS